MTGVRITGCPWMALSDPLVTRAIQLFNHYETGNLSAFLTEQDSEREWQALEYYVRVSNIVRSKQWEERQAEIRRKARQEVKPNGK